MLDYHLHTAYSFDGKMTICEACETALNKGLKEICFTEHFSVLSHDPSYLFLDINGYQEELNHFQSFYRGRLTIRRGLEIGEPHLQKEDITAVTKNMALDYIIGSIHNIGRDKLRKFQNPNNTIWTYRRYFETVYQAVQNGDFDVIGHFDLIKRYVPKEKAQYCPKNYAEIIDCILKTAIQRNIGLEVNSSNLLSLGEFYPKYNILKRYFELGGSIVTFGSDAHTSELIHAGYNDSVEFIKSCGFRYVCGFENRKPCYYLI